VFLVYIHDPKDKILITLGVPPKDVTTIQLPTSSESEIYHIEILLFEKQISIMNKNTFPCKKYEVDELDFTRCSQKLFDSNLKDKINCTLAGNEKF
jgi:hypothetical protein